MNKRVQKLLSNIPTYNEEVPDKPKRSLGQSIINALRKTLTASSVNFLETLQEESKTTEQECPIVSEFGNDDIEEAIRRSIADAIERRHAFDAPCEIELERMDRGGRLPGDGISWYDYEGSCSGQMTPKSSSSSRFQASSSTGVTYQDLYSLSSDEYRRT